MCGCDKKKEVKEKVVKEEKGKTKPLCKKVKFTLVVTLHFDNKTIKKLKSHFNSKPDVGGCNLPETKDFTKAYRKLMNEYRESLPKDSLSKSTLPKLVNRSTQIYSTVGDDKCSVCQCQTLDICGTTKNIKGCYYCAGSQGKNKCWTKCN